MHALNRSDTPVGRSTQTLPQAESSRRSYINIAFMRRTDPPSIQLENTLETQASANNSFPLGAKTRVTLGMGVLNYEDPRLKTFVSHSISFYYFKSSF